MAKRVCFDGSDLYNALITKDHKRLYTARRENSILNTYVVIYARKVIFTSFFGINMDRSATRPSAAKPVFRLQRRSFRVHDKRYFTELETLQTHKKIINEHNKNKLITLTLAAFSVDIVSIRY